MPIEGFKSFREDPSSHSIHTVLNVKHKDDNYFFFFFTSISYLSGFCLKSFAPAKMPNSGKNYDFQKTQRLQKCPIVIEIHIFLKTHLNSLVLVTQSHLIVDLAQRRFILGGTQQWDNG